MTFVVGWLGVKNQLSIYLPTIPLLKGDGRCSSVVRESDFKPEDLGFDPLAGQGENQFFSSLRVNSCADLFVPDPPFVFTARTQICEHVKDPISICRKRVDLTAGGMETQYTQEKKTPG